MMVLILPVRVAFFWRVSNFPNAESPSSPIRCFLLCVPRNPTSPANGVLNLSVKQKLRIGPHPFWRGWVGRLVVGAPHRLSG